jgi:hypothetical protein
LKLFTISCLQSVTAVKQLVGTNYIRIVIELHLDVIRLPIFTEIGRRTRGEGRGVAGFILVAALGNKAYIILAI